LRMAISTCSVLGFFLFPWRARSFRDKEVVARSLARKGAVDLFPVAGVPVTPTTFRMELLHQCDSEIVYRNQDDGEQEQHPARDDDDPVDEVLQR